MFADPQTIVINGVNKSLAKVESKGQSSIYKTGDDLYKLTISHLQQRERIRSMWRIDHRAIVTNPLNQEMDYDTLTTYHVLDRPVFGFSQATTENVIIGLTDWINSGGNIIGRLMGGEH